MWKLPVRQTAHALSKIPFKTENILIKRANTPFFKYYENNKEYFFIIFLGRRTT